MNNTNSLAEKILAEMKADYEKRQAARAAFDAAKPEVEIDGRRFSVVEASSYGPGSEPFAFVVNMGGFFAYVDTRTKRIETVPEFANSIMHSRPFSEIKILDSVRAAREAARAVFA